jgi:hypothetical protein
MPVNGIGHFDQSPCCSLTALAFAEDLLQNNWKPVPLRCQSGPTRNPLPSQDFALSKVSSGSSSKDPKSPAQDSFQASFIGDSALAVHHEFKPQVPAGRPKKHRV